MQPEPAGPLLQRLPRQHRPHADATPSNFVVALNARIQQRDRLYHPHGNRRAGRPEETLGNAHGLLPRFELAAGPGPAQSRPRRALRLRLPDPAQARPRLARRPAPAPTTISPTCTPGARSTSPAPAGSASTRPPACSPAKATSRSPPRRIIATPRRSPALPAYAEVDFAFDMRVDPRRRASAHHQAVLRRQPGTTLERARPAGRRDPRRQRRPPHHGRRADLRLHRRFRSRRVEHRRRRPDQARPRRRPDPPPARPLRARRLPALRPGQMVSRRNPAALDLLALLARRRQAGLEGRGARRRAKASRPPPRTRTREKLLDAHRRTSSASTGETVDAGL